MGVGRRKAEDEWQAGAATHKRMQAVAAQQRSGMVGRGMADGGVGIGPAPGQEGRALHDPIAPVGQPQPSPHQQDTERLAGRRPRRAQPLGLLRLAGQAHNQVCSS